MKTTIALLFVVSLLLLNLHFSISKVLATDLLSDESSSLYELLDDRTVNGWAVLLEMNNFPEGWTNLPVNFINSRGMQEALVNLGWNSDHMYVKHDNLTIPTVQEALEWLNNNTSSEDVALLYIFTHGMWMRNVLRWNDWFPG